MLGKLELKLKSKEKLEYQMSSLFHGALMEVLPESMLIIYIRHNYIHIHSTWNFVKENGIGLSVA